MSSGRGRFLRELLPRQPRARPQAVSAPLPSPSLASEHAPRSGTERSAFCGALQTATLGASLGKPSCGDKRPEATSLRQTDEAFWEKFLKSGTFPIFQTPPSVRVNCGTM